MVGKIPSLSGLATNSALNAVDNEIPDVRNLVEKTDYDTKFTEIEKKKKIMIMIMINILPLQILISLQKNVYCKISTSKFNNKNRL